MTRVPDLGISTPLKGDVLAAERSARADVFGISIVAADGHAVVPRYSEAIEVVCELSRTPPSRRLVHDRSDALCPRRLISFRPLTAIHGDRWRRGRKRRKKRFAVSSPSLSMNSAMRSIEMKVLLAIDGLPHSQTAVEQVATRIWPAGTVVKILTVFHPGSPAVEPTHVVAGHAEQAEKLPGRALEIVAAAARQIIRGEAEVGVTIKIISGTPKTAIIS